MGATEIIKALEKNPNMEFTSTELQNIMDCAASSVRHALKNLFKDPLQPVERRVLSFDEKKEKYGRVINPRIIVYWIGI